MATCVTIKLTMPATARLWSSTVSVTVPEKAGRDLPVEHFAPGDNGTVDAGMICVYSRTVIIDGTEAEAEKLLRRMEWYIQAEGLNQSVPVTINAKQP